jgi:bifunctional ADP-heptose synthase (sugar kinase/adenylyltransferase)
MELFTIERYEGDSFAAKNYAEKESQNLAQLLEQARGRKRSVESSNYQKGDETSQTTVDESTKEVESVLVASPKVKKKKKGEKKKDEGLKRNKQEFEDLKPSESVENGTEDDDAVKILEGGLF